MPRGELRGAHEPDLRRALGRSDSDAAAPAAAKKKKKKKICEKKTNATPLKLAVLV